MSFRETLLRLRAEHNISQQELAEKLDVSRQSISRWESGKSVPSANQIANICKVFGLSADELVRTEPAESGRNAPASAQGERADLGAEEGAAGRKKAYIAAIVCLALLLACAAAGLAATVFYAVKDASFDAVSTVWIVAIPRNTPMIVLALFLGVLILLLVLAIVLLVRRRHR